MTKEELLEAIDDATDENGRGKEAKASLEAMTKDDLMQMARQRDLNGRSDMTKNELAEALRVGG